VQYKKKVGVGLVVILGKLPHYGKFSGWQLAIGVRGLGETNLPPFGSMAECMEAGTEDGETRFSCSNPVYPG